jgi:drug/metabolite transporter (DMT)-like permease
VPGGRVLGGIALGIVGVGILAGGQAFNGGLLSDRLIISFGAVCWAAGSLVGRHGARPAVATQGTVMQLTTGALWTFGASAVHGDLAHFTPSQLTTEASLALVFLVVCGTVLAFTAFTWLLQVTSPAAISSYAFVNPIVALSLGVLVGDDRLSGRVILSAALVVGAVVLTIRAAPPTAPALRPRPRSALEPGRG